MSPFVAHSFGAEFFLQKKVIPFGSVWAVAALNIFYTNFLPVSGTKTSPGGTGWWLLVLGLTCKNGHILYWIGQSVSMGKQYMFGLVPDGW